MAGGDTPRPRRPENRARCLLRDDIDVFRANKGPTETYLLLFGLETMSSRTAVYKGGKGYRGVVETGEYFMTRWPKHGAGKP